MSEPRRITSIEANPEDPMMLDIHLGNELLGELTRDDVEELELVIGLEEHDDKVIALRRAIEFKDARTQAFKILARKERASGEIIRRLEARGHSNDLATDVAGELIEDGWLDDEGYTRRRLEQLRDADGRSTQICREKLLKEGVPESVAEPLLQAAGTGDGDVEAACTALRKAMSRSSRNADGSPAAARRLAASLQRQGFDSDTMSTAFSRLSLIPPGEE